MIKIKSQDKIRNYKIIIDGRNYGIIGSGKTKEIDIAPGNHEIFLKIDWCRSNKIDFNISRNQTIEFECGNSITGWKLIFVCIYITFLKNRYLWINILD